MNPMPKTETLIKVALTSGLVTAISQISAYANTQSIEAKQIGKPVMVNPLDDLLLDELIPSVSTSKLTNPEKTSQPTDNKQHSQTQDTISQLSQTRIKQLSEHPTWRRLLHYRDGKNVSSAKMKANFFIHPNGANSPLDELQSTVALLQSDNTQSSLKSNLKTQSNLQSQGDEDAIQCRFPARVHWLKQQLNLNLAKANCPSYDKWMSEHDPKQLAVAFVQEYPDNPASAFAHTLLQVNSKNDKSYAVNYTVAGDPEASQFEYFIKSSTGKYAGLMTIEDYENKVKKYLTKDQRDIWSYPIKLTSAENEQIMRHVWEVKDLGLPYYFLADNCSSEILRLVDIVRPDGNLYAQTKTFTIPSEIIRLMQTQGLLEQGKYYPAKASYQQSKQNKPAKQSKTINQKANKTTNKTRQPRNSLANQQKVGLTNVTVQNNPIDANHLKKITIQMGENDGQKYVEFGGRVTYRDLLDATIGHRQNMDMQALEMSARVYPDAEGLSEQLKIQQFTLLAGRSYNPINTARKGINWGIDMSAKQVNDASVDIIEPDRLDISDIENTESIKSLEGVNNLQSMSDQKTTLYQQHLVGNLSVQRGVSYAFGNARSDYELPEQLCYAFGGGGVQFGRAITNGYRVGIGADIGCAVQLGDKLRGKAEVSLPYWYHGDSNLAGRTSGYWQPVASVGMQYDVAKNQGIRLTAQHELSDRVLADTDVQLGWHFYF